MYTAAYESNMNYSYNRSRSRRRKAARSFQIHKIIMFIAFTLMIAFLCGITFGSIMSSAKTTEEKSLDTYKYYKTISVESGDTLWDIAVENITSDYDSVDEYIAEVCSINGISGTQIRAGRSLTVPYYSADFK